MNGGMEQNWLGVFRSMAGLPFRMFRLGAETMVKAMSGMWQLAGQAGTEQPGSDREGSQGAGSAGTTGAQGTDNNSSMTVKEPKKMPDQDLSGADTLKLVRYKIVFVKRDYEVAFDEHNELVNYATTGPAFAALKIAEFMGQLGHILRPRQWKECDTHYPPGEQGEYIVAIPPCDYKYVQIYFEVLQRWDRQESDYDRQTVDALRGIRSEIREGFGLGH